MSYTEILRMRAAAVGLLLLALLGGCDARRHESASPLATAAAQPAPPRGLAAVSKRLGLAVRNGIGGVMIVGLEVDGPAATAGARVGDFIVGINGSAVASEADFVDLVAAAPSAGVAFNLWRQGETVSLSVEPGVAPGSSPAALQEPKPPLPVELPASKLGLQVRELPAVQARSIGLDFGLIITKVRAPADRSRLMPGDVIVGVNQAPLHSLQQFNALVSAHAAGTAIGLTVRRAERDLYISLDAGGSGPGGARLPEDAYKTRQPSTDTPLRT